MSKTIYLNPEDLKDKKKMSKVFFTIKKNRFKSKLLKILDKYGESIFTSLFKTIWLLILAIPLMYIWNNHISGDIFTTANQITYPQAYILLLFLYILKN